MVVSGKYFFPFLYHELRTGIRNFTFQIFVTGALFSSHFDFITPYTLRHDSFFS